MKRVSILALILLNLAVSGDVRPSASATTTCKQTPEGNRTQPRLRIALIALARAKVPQDSRSAESALADALTRDSRVELIDQSIIQAALAGVGYDGSINMSKEEARRLGAAVGCDFFIIGKSEVLTRSAHEKESHEEAYVGLMIVDGRTGALARFDLITEKASTKEASIRALVTAVHARGGDYADQMIQARELAQQPLSIDLGSDRPSPRELIEEMPDQDSPRAVGFTPPDFLNRVKPEYTSEAEQADITAMVEATAIFRANGEVGVIQITRWAGFGLDNSAKRAIQQLKFKPATRDGKPISVRAMIRYNFRRMSEQPNLKPEPPAPKQPDKPERDLRQLFKPTYRRP